jgi:hypothetical protein
LFCILSTCPYHLILEDFINFTISAPFTISFISFFFLILQRSPSFVGPYIFLIIFLSGIQSAFISSIASVQVSDP